MNNLTTGSDENSKKKRVKVMKESYTLEKRKLSFDNESIESLISSEKISSEIKNRTKTKSQNKKKQIKQDNIKSNSKSNLISTNQVFVNFNADESHQNLKACHDYSM